MTPHRNSTGGTASHSLSPVRSCASTTSQSGRIGCSRRWAAFLRSFRFRDSACLGGRQPQLALGRAGMLLPDQSHRQLVACCDIPLWHALAAARKSARGLRYHGGMGHHAEQTEWGRCGEAHPRVRRPRHTCGSANHHPAPLSVVGASIGGGMACCTCRKVSCGHSPQLHRMLCMVVC